MLLDGVVCGSCLCSIDGELDGDADIRVSLSVGSSEALRLRPEDIIVGEVCPSGLVSTSGMATFSRTVDIREGLRRLGRRWGAKCGCVGRTLFMAARWLLPKISGIWEMEGGSFARC
jgi:hypothetical protein